MDQPICPLCDRPIPPEALQSLHHLVPRSKGGKRGETVLLHQICHDTIHATLREAEIARRYATIDALREHPDLARFRAWIGTKPPTFHASTAKPPGGRRG